MPNSRRKGHDYERDTAAWYRSRGIEAKRGFQSRAGDDDPDVVLGPPRNAWMWIECKRYASLGLVGRAWEQAKAVCGDRDPVLHVKADRGDDLVVISRETWGRLIGKDSGYVGTEARVPTNPG